MSEKKTNENSRYVRKSKKNSESIVVKEQHVLNLQKIEEKNSRYINRL
jgi:hypothetical protein